MKPICNFYINTTFFENLTCEFCSKNARSYLVYGKEFINQRSTTFDAQYKFSGKERDIETGYGYFGARYYSSELGIWISTDPMAGKYPSSTPYAYCRNNPIMLVDPNGMEDGNFHDWSGKYLGNDGKKDNNVFIVRDKSSIKTIKSNEKSGGTTQSSDVKVDISTNKEVLAESVDVYDRTVKNGGNDEETSAFDNNGNIHRTTGKGTTAKLGISEGTVSIHSHSLGDSDNGLKHLGVPDVPSDDYDLPAFKGFKLNIIVGDFAAERNLNGYFLPRTSGAVFYDSNAKTIGIMNFNEIHNILKK
jgi:RHS repeat-associated protein